MLQSKELKRSFDENLLNDYAKNDVALKEEIQKNSDFMSNFKSTNDDCDKSVLVSVNFRTDQHKKFITMCKQELSDDLPMDFNQWTLKEQYNHLINNISKYFPNIPKSLRSILPATFEDGDCGRSANERPDWLDMNKFYRGQQFALRYFCAISLSNLISLPLSFSFADGLKPLILSQKSSTPYNAFKRYLSSIRHFRNWYTSDPWCEGTQAYHDIQVVRKLHRAMRQKLCSMSDDEIDLASKMSYMKCPMFQTIAKDFADACPLAKSRQCPFTMSRIKGLNQGDMFGTQFACMGLIVLYPEQFGIYDASDEDLEAFCHLWRGLGYLLGMQDQYNFCRGSLQDIRQRIEDCIEYWVKPNLRTVTAEWEHMTLCLYEGIAAISSLSSYKVFLLYLCDIFKLKMPRLYSSLNFWDRIVYVLLKFQFLYLTKLPGVFPVMNAMFHKDLNRAANFGFKEHAKLKLNYSESSRNVMHI
ncbi:uncharacterized protein LOC105254238 isoform X1 [Camponotus floridanus]|nr:uncharacterized protein LOC105254238 isoform X1 [Camponotus floridanus]XP_025265762.1 uncharacterized protein LOC105254238 isoform X1 [Camponotus floridanus]XP_025265763.1 uncharacterized protein LOC105254238 isoform X1 [Camponotus floridanus]